MNKKTMNEKKMKKANIVIVDYDMGNIKSIHNALVRMGGNVSTSRCVKDVLAADAIVLPGVGAFRQAMSNLKSFGLIDPIIHAAKDQGKPLLGICLGMQLLADSSDERGYTKGLSLIPGSVRPIPEASDIRLPHVGWNSLSIDRRESLFTHMDEGDSVYFVHSYHFVCAKDYIAATTDHGGEVVAAVQQDNIFGVQFHPECSQRNGLLLLRNFIDYANQSCVKVESC